MDYKKIVEKLNEKIKYYETDILFTPRYAAVEFCDEYGIINEKNIPSIWLGDLFKLILIKLDLYTPEVASTYMDNTYIDYGFDNIVNEYINNHNKVDIDTTVTLIRKIGVSYDERVRMSEHEKRFLTLVYTLLDDPEINEFVNDFINYCDEIGTQNEITASERRKITKLAPKGYSVNWKEFKKAHELASSQKEFLKEYDGFLKKMKEYTNFTTDTANSLTTKKIDNMVSRYKNALTKFEESCKMDDMTICLDAVSAIDDEELLKEIYMFINEHNMPYFKKIEAEYEEKNKNTEYGYIDFFKHYGLDFSALKANFKNKIMEDGIAVTKSKIAIISRFADKNDYFRLIAGSTIESLVYIDELYKNSIIDLEFIKSNIDLIDNSSLFDRFKANYELLCGKVNIKKYVNKLFLLGDSNIIRDNITLMDKYGIQYKNCSDLSFITSSIIDKLSLFIEVGLENEIFNNPDILNVDIDLAKRVLLYEMVEDLDKKERLSESIVNKELFFVAPSRVNMVLERDNSTYNNGGEMYLSEFDSTKLSYIIDGVVIPKTRVIEQPIRLDSIIKPSLYSKDEIKILEKNATK